MLLSEIRILTLEQKLQLVMEGLDEEYMKWMNKLEEKDPNDVAREYLSNLKKVLKSAPDKSRPKIEKLIIDIKKMLDAGYNQKQLKNKITSLISNAILSRLGLSVI